MLKIKNSLVWKLTIWFLLLSILPIIAMTIFVRQTIENEITDLAQNSVSNRSALLARQLSFLTEDEAPEFLEDRIREGQIAFVVTQSGMYNAHTDRTKVGASVFNDFPNEVAQQSQQNFGYYSLGEYGVLPNNGGLWVQFLRVE